MQKNAFDKKAVEAQQNSLNSMTQNLRSIDKRIAIFVEDEYNVDFEVEWDDENETE